MAITQNTYTGNGSLTEYSFTFPYLEESDVKVSLDGTIQPTTAYSFANATTISFNTAPADGAAIRIYRETAQEATPATFFAGSAIRASDLNDNFLQQLYVAQETSRDTIDAVAGTIPDGTITTNKLASNLTIDLASGTVGLPSLTFDANTGLYSPDEDQVAISTNGTQRLLIANNGWVGVGVTPESALHVKGPQPSIVLENSSGFLSALILKTTGSAQNDYVIATNSSGTEFASNRYTFKNVGSTAEYMRLDSDGRLLLGTPVSIDTGTFVNGIGDRYYAGLQLASAEFRKGSISLSSYQSGSNVSSQVSLNKSKSGTVGDFGVNALVNGDDLGQVVFSGDDGSKFVPAAVISGEVDGTPGNDDMPGRIVLSTTEDGESSPTERLRIASTGAVGLSGANYGTSGQVLTSNGSSAAPTWQSFSAPAGTVIYYAGSTAPSGYLKANGDTIPNGSGTVQGVTADFSALYAVIGSTYGSAGQLPDLRGEFLRGWDDGRGVDSGRGFGTSQEDAFEAHSHKVGARDSLTTYGTDATVEFVSNLPSAQSQFVTSESVGGTETRPRNIALLACIKY